MMLDDLFEYAEVSTQTMSTWVKYLFRRGELWGGGVVVNVLLPNLREVSV